MRSVVFVWFIICLALSEPSSSPSRFWEILAKIDVLFFAFWQKGLLSFNPPWYIKTVGNSFHMKNKTNSMLRTTTNPSVLLLVSWQPILILVSFLHPFWKHGLFCHVPVVLDFLKLLLTPSRQVPCFFLYPLCDWYLCIWWAFWSIATSLHTIV